MTSHAKFDELITPHIPFISSLVRKYSRDPNLHCDHSQECLLQLWRKLDSFEPARASIQGWISMICRSKLCDLYRAKLKHIKPQTNLEFDLTSPEPSDHYPSISFFEPLSDEMRLFLRGTPLKVVASLCNEAFVPTIKSRLQRERLRLKEKTHVA